ncbi:MAG: PIN domain-containing protein, partial [Candidatus Rokuibacteriota bacterium]
VRRGLASALVELECLRTLDRLRLAHDVPDAALALRREAVLRLIESIEIVECDRRVLQRAAQPLPTALGTLDSIHLATALLWQEGTRARLVMATHDEALAIAARAYGLRVVGV